MAGIQSTVPVLASPEDPVVVQPWGMKELHMIDPHGNLLKLGEPA